MNDKLIRFGAVGMIGIAMSVGYILMQSSSASSGPRVNVPVTANSLQPTINESTIVLAEDALPSAPAEKATPQQLGQPGTEIARRDEVAVGGVPQVASMDVPVPQFNVPDLAIPKDPAAQVVADLQVEAPGSGPDVSAVELTATDLQAMDECEPLMRLDIEDNAMLRVLVSAPCNAGESVQIEHGSLIYTVAIDSEGGHLSSIPVLSSDANVTVSFSNGTLLSESIFVDEALNYRRFALVGETMMDLELHAYEAGATFGSEGHVYFGNPGSEGLTRGKMYLLGDTNADAPYFVQVYSMPVTAADVDLTVEAVVNGDNCGLDRGALALVAEGGSVIEKAFEIALPGCDAVGEFVILPGLFDLAQS